MANLVNHKKGIILSDLDIEIFKALYKADFLCDYHVALIVGENKAYIGKRLRDLATGGFIGRKVLKADCPAANWVTKLGMKRAELYLRNVRQPTLGRYEHSLGCADIYTYFCLLRRFKDGSIRRFVNFGEIITERDFNAVRELKQVGTKKNGQPLLKSMDFDIHHPDGYFCRDGLYYALEFERTAKSTYDIVVANVRDNAKRFVKQFWVYDHKAVFNYLKKAQLEVGAERLQIIDIRKVREQLMKAVSYLPAVISKKTGIPRNSALGTMVKPTPLNRIPLLLSAVKAPTLESRKESAASHPPKLTAKAHLTKVTTQKSKPQLNLEKRRK